MPVAEEVSVENVAAPTSVDSRWARMIAGEGQTPPAWEAQSGDWNWDQNGVTLAKATGEWSNLVLGPIDAQRRNFLIEANVSGKAEVAGFSFGDFKDFLAPLHGGPGTRRIQLEIDADAARWALRVDGQLQRRAWWDAAVHGTNDLLGAAFRFKARHAHQVRFEDLTIRPFESSCKLSVITTCHRFLQRMRVTLRNWCHQTIPRGAHEILVVNPSSPDGLHEHLAAVSSSFPHVRVREIQVEGELATNKSVMINRAFQESRGDWIWLADADCLFPPTAVELTLKHLSDRADRLFYCRRYHLTPAQTNDLLSGRADSLADFEALRSSANGPDHAPYGYTQIIHRSRFERIKYRERYNTFAQSDWAFVQDCKRWNILPHSVDGLACLHLHHPFAWNGTNLFL
jgi:hypothetical protein